MTKNKAQPKTPKGATQSNEEDKTTPRVAVITVDGPSGVGKGTISQALAKKLGWHYLDSGALYRLLACAAQKRGISLDDEQALAALVGELDIRFEEGAVLDGELVEGEIRSEKMGNCASKVARHPAVRQALLDRQKAFAQAPGLVADGRDMGTTVFPESRLKIYLTASVEERARRRAKQLSAMGQGGSIAALCREIAERDARDAERKASPLRPADDAQVIDTSDLSIDEVLDAVADEAEKTEFD